MLRLVTRPWAGLWMVTAGLGLAAVLFAADEAPPPATDPDETAVEAVPATGVADGRAALRRLEREAEQRIRRALQTEVTLSFQDAPLGQALQQLAAKGEFPLWIDETSLIEEGISTDEPVAVRFSETSVEIALERILEPLGLATLIEDEVLKVTTESETQSRLSTRIYPVRELLQLAEQARLSAQLERQRQTMTVQFDDAGGFAGAPPMPHSKDSWLIEVVFDATSGNWESGTGRLLDGVLIIRQTQRVHGQIGPLLDALEHTARGDLPHGSVTVRPKGYPREKERAIHEALMGTTEADFDDRALRSALGSLARQFGIPIIIDEVALTEEGISIDEPISVHVRNVTLNSLLKLILEPLGLTALVRNGYLEVTSEVEASEHLVTTVYDVRDLAESGIGRVELLESIQAAASGNWESIDGVGGTALVPFPGVLVVRQTPRVQGEIESLLANLRDVLQRDQPTGAAVPAADPKAVSIRLYSTAGLMAPAQDISKAIPTFVARQLGGEPGDLDVGHVGGTLMIITRERAHAAIRNFLDQLRAAEAGDPPQPTRDTLGSAGRPAGGSGMGSPGGGFF